MTEQEKQRLGDLCLLFEALPIPGDDETGIGDLAENDEIDQIRQMVLEVSDERPIFMTTT